MTFFRYKNENKPAYGWGKDGYSYVVMINAIRREKDISIFQQD